MTGVQKMTETEPKTYRERITDHDLDREQEAESKILHYAEDSKLKPWTLVDKVSDDTNEDHEDVKRKMKEMVFDWKLQIRSGGYMDVDRHE